MNQNDLLFFYSWFQNFAESYYSKESYVQINIKLKEEHTYRVCKNIRMIGRELNLDERQLQIGETAALLHDTGRFEQFKRFKTFNDRQSQNHAKLSVEIIKQKNILTRLPKKEEKIICKAISYHNLYKLPLKESKICLLYTKLLRDADKLDIWSTILDYYSKRHLHPNPALELELPDTPEYSPEFIDNIMNYRCTDMSKIKTYNDMKISLLSWIFDVNFSPTYKQIKKSRYIDRIVEILPKTEEIQKVQNHINEYIEKKSYDKNLT